MSKIDAQSTAAQLRIACRANELTTPTSGLALGYVQANLVVLPKEYAFDFLLFCQRNPKPCPLLDVTDPGDPEPKRVAPGSDLRTDLPRYAVYTQGKLTETPTDTLRWWRSDMVAFLLGCSFTFEAALLKAGLPVRHIEQGVNVPMFKTNIPNKKAGIFQGNLVVSMRPFPPDLVAKASSLSATMPQAHGAPVHLGDPSQIGIIDLQRPDFGDTVEIRPGEVPVFWACGVTPQVAIMQAKPSIALTHLPGHMFLTDLRESDLIHNCAD
jgi:uncharacterized protein YcsI (UPF0317 family)